MANTIPVTVDALYLYPVKSCAPLPVKSLTFDAQGMLVGDREWAIVDEHANLVWQGSHPKLALVHPRLSSGVLSLRNPAGDCVDLGEEGDQSPCKVHIWNEVTQQNDTYDALDEGDACAAFLLRTVGAPLRLSRLGRSALHRQNADRVHIVSQSSFREFAVALAPDEQPLAMLERFRPNIVIDDAGDALLPFIEEHFETLEWTSGTTPSGLVVCDPCVRCVVPNVDPRSGRVDAQILPVIGKLSAQRYPNGPICFGVYARSTGPSTLAQGAELSASLNF